MRMTWEEIKERYPDQWVGLVDVKYEEDNDATIESAVVKYSDKTGDELLLIALESDEDIAVLHTDPDSDLPLGMAPVMDWICIDGKKYYF